jgi:Protein of unknown function (DUF1153)
MSSQRRKITRHGITFPLPACASSRRIAGRKVAVITAIRVGAVTFSEACERYRLSDEKLSEWEAAFDENGIAGLQKKNRSIRAENRAQS